MTVRKDHPFKPANMPFAMKLFFVLATIMFKVLGLVSPKLAGKLALKLFMKPPRVSAPAREKEIRAQAQLSFKEMNGRQIAVRTWGVEANANNKPKPTVLLSHGWAGRTTQFLNMIPPLVDAGYQVVGADIPAHGDSTGTETNMLDTAQVIATIATEFETIDAIIGHSFGTGTALLALDKFQIATPKIIMIGAYSRVSFIINLFSEVFDFSQTVIDAMKQAGTDSFADSYGIAWDWENIAPVNTIKNYHGKILFIHDKDDHEVPMHEVTELHQMYNSAEIMITKGLGHRRILRDDAVTAKVIQFIQE